MDWDTLLSRLDILVKRYHRLLYLGYEDREQIIKINEKIRELIPSKIVIENRILIKKLIYIFNSSLESAFKIIANQLGLDLLNVLMYLYGIFQSNSMCKSVHNIIEHIASSKFENLEGKDFRRFSRFLLGLEYTLRSAMEYLLKNHKDHVIEFKNSIKRPINKILHFINDFYQYKTSIEQLLWLDFPHLKEVKYTLGPGYYTYLYITHEWQEYGDYAKKGYEVWLNWDLSKDWYFDFNEITQQFSSVMEIWKKKFGYTLKNLVKAIAIFHLLFLDRFEPFFIRLGEFPILEINEVSKKSLDKLEEELNSFLVKIIENYFRNARNKNCLISFKELNQRFYKEIRNDGNEIDKILTELCVDANAPYIPYWNRLANRFLYPIDNDTAFIYPNNTYSALKERLYLKLIEIDEPEKEYVLTNHIKNILNFKGYTIHPLSGVYMIDENKKTLGEIDLVAYKARLLLLIESKIIPQRKTSIEFLKNYEQILKNISKKLSRFDRNIEIFEKFCSNPANFHNYNDISLDINKFTKKQYFFISPYLIYNPPPFKRIRPIEVINPTLFERFI